MYWHLQPWLRSFMLAANVFVLVLFKTCLLTNKCVVVNICKYVTTCGLYLLHLVVHMYVLTYCTYRTTYILSILYIPHDLYTVHTVHTGPYRTGATNIFAYCVAQGGSFYVKQWIVLVQSTYTYAPTLWVAKRVVLVCCLVCWSC